MIETADEELTQMALGSQEQQQPMITNPILNPGYMPGDEKLFVKFYYHPKQDKKKSEEEGRPIFKDTVYIEIMQPGNKENIINRPASKRDIQRFLRQYQQFTAMEKQVMEGTPLDKAPFLTGAQVEELKFFNVFTVEQLSDIPDSQGHFIGFQMLKQKAKAFLEAADGSKGATSLVTKVAELEAKLEAEKQNNIALREKVDELEQGLENTGE